MADFYDPACPTEEEMQGEKRTASSETKKSDADSSSGNCGDSTPTAKGNKKGNKKSKDKPKNPFIKPVPQMTAIQKRLQSLSQVTDKKEETQPKNFLDTELVEVRDTGPITKKKKKKKKKSKQIENDIADYDMMDMNDDWLPNEMDDIESGAYGFPPQLMQLELDQPFHDGPNPDEQGHFPSRRGRGRNRRNRHDGPLQNRDDGDPAFRGGQQERHFQGPPRPLMEMFGPDAPPFNGPNGNRFRGQNGPQFRQMFPGPNGPRQQGPNGPQRFGPNGPQQCGPRFHGDDHQFQGSHMDNQHFHDGDGPMDNQHFHGSGPPPHFQGSGPPMENEHFHGNCPPMENQHFHGNGPPLENQHFGPPMENQHFHGNGPPMENQQFPGNGPPMENQHFHGNCPPMENQHFHGNGPPMENQQFTSSDGPPWQGPPVDTMFQGMPPPDGQHWNYPAVPPYQGMGQMEAQPYQGTYQPDGQPFQTMFPPPQMQDNLQNTPNFNQTSIFPVAGEQAMSNFNMLPPTPHIPPVPPVVGTDGSISLSSIPVPPPPKDPPPPLASNIALPLPSDIPMPPTLKSSESASTNIFQSDTEAKSDITSTMTSFSSHTVVETSPTVTSVSSNFPLAVPTVPDAAEVPKSAQTSDTDIPSLSPGEPEEVKNVTEHIAANGETTLVIENKPVVGTSPTSDFLDNENKTTKQEKQPDIGKPQETEVPQDPIKTTAQKLLEKIALKKKAAAEGLNSTITGKPALESRSSLVSKPLLKPVSKFLLQQGYKLKEQVQKGGQKDGKLQFNVKSTGPVVQKLNPLQKVNPNEKAEIEEKNKGGAKELYKPTKDDEEELMVDKLSPKQRELYYLYKAKEIERKIRLKEEIEKEKEAEQEKEKVEKEKVEKEKMEKEKVENIELASEKQVESQSKDQRTDDEPRKNRNKSEEREESSYRPRYSRRYQMVESRGYRDDRRDRRSNRSRRSRSRDRTSERRNSPEISPRRSPDRVLEKDRYHDSKDSSPKRSRSNISSRENSPERSRRLQKTLKYRSDSTPKDELQKDISPKRKADRFSTRDQRSGSKSPEKSDISSSTKETPKSPQMSSVPDLLKVKSGLCPGVVGSNTGSSSPVVGEYQNKSFKLEHREKSRSRSPEKSKRSSVSPYRIRKMSSSPERLSFKDSSKKSKKQLKTNEDLRISRESPDRGKTWDVSPRQSKNKSESPNRHSIKSEMSRSYRDVESESQGRKRSQSPEKVRTQRRSRKSPSSPWQSDSPKGSVSAMDSKMLYESPKHKLSPHSPDESKQKLKLKDGAKVKSISPERSRWSSDSRDSSPQRSRWSSRSPKTKRSRHLHDILPNHRKPSLSPEGDMYKSKSSRKTRKGSASPKRERSRSKSPKMSKKSFPGKQRQLSVSPQRRDKTYSASPDSRERKMSVSPKTRERNFCPSPERRGRKYSSPERRGRKFSSSPETIERKLSFSHDRKESKFSISPDARKIKFSQSPERKGRRYSSSPERRGKKYSPSPERRGRTISSSPERERKSSRFHKKSKKSAKKGKKLAELSKSQKESSDSPPRRVRSPDLPVRSHKSKDSPERIIDVPDRLSESYKKWRESQGKLRGQSDVSSGSREPSRSPDKDYKMSQSPHRSSYQTDLSPVRSKNRSNSPKARKSKKKKKKHSKERSHSAEKTKEDLYDPFECESHSSQEVAPKQSNKSRWSDAPPMPSHENQSEHALHTTHSDVTENENNVSKVLDSKHSDGKKVHDDYDIVHEREKMKAYSEGMCGSDKICQETDDFSKVRSSEMNASAGSKTDVSSCQASVQENQVKKCDDIVDMDVCDSDSNQSSQIYQYNMEQTKSNQSDSVVIAQETCDVVKMEVSGDDIGTASVEWSHDSSDLPVGSVRDFSKILLDKNGDSRESSNSSTSLTMEQTMESHDIDDHTAASSAEHASIPASQDYDDNQDSRKKKSRRSVESKEEKMKRELRKLHIDMEKNVFELEDEQPKRRSRRSRSRKSTDSNQMDMDETQEKSEIEENTQRKLRRTSRNCTDSESTKESTVSSERTEASVDINDMGNNQISKMDETQAVKLEDQTAEQADMNISKGRKRGKKGRWLKSKTEPKKVEHKKPEDITSESLTPDDLANISLPAESNEDPEKMVDQKNEISSTEESRNTEKISTNITEQSLSKDLIRNVTEQEESVKTRNSQSCVLSFQPGQRMPVKFQLPKIVQNLSSATWDDEDSNDAKTDQKMIPTTRNDKFDGHVTGSDDNVTSVDLQQLKSVDSETQNVEHVCDEDDPEISFKFVKQDTKISGVRERLSQDKEGAGYKKDKKLDIFDLEVEEEKKNEEKSKITEKSISENTNISKSIPATEEEMDKMDVEIGGLKSICAYSDSEGEDDMGKFDDDVKGMNKVANKAKLEISEEQHIPKEDDSLMDPVKTATNKPSVEPEKYTHKSSGSTKSEKYDPFQDALQRAKDLVDSKLYSTTKTSTQPQENYELKENKEEVKSRTTDSVDIHSTVDMELDSDEDDIHDASLDSKSNTDIAKPEVFDSALLDIPLPESNKKDNLASKVVVDSSVSKTFDLSTVMLPGEKTVLDFSPSIESKNLKTEVIVKGKPNIAFELAGNNQMDTNEEKISNLAKMEERPGVEVKKQTEIDSQDEIDTTTADTVIKEADSVLKKEEKRSKTEDAKDSKKHDHEEIKILKVKEVEKRSFMKLEMKRPLTDVRNVSSSISSVFDLSGNSDTKPSLGKVTDEIASKKKNIFEDSDVKTSKPLSRFLPMVRDKNDGSPATKRTSNLIKIGPIKLPAFTDTADVIQGSDGRESNSEVEDSGELGRHEQCSSQSEMSTISRLITPRNMDMESVASPAGFAVMPKSVPSPQWNDSNVYESKQQLSDPVPDTVAMTMQMVDESDYDKKVDEFLKKTETAQPTFEQKVDEFLKKVEKPKPTVERKFDEFLEKVRKSNEDRKIDEFLEKVKKPTLEQKVDEFLKKTEKKESKPRDDEYKSSKYHSKDDYDHDKYRSRDYRDDRDYKDRHEWEKKSKRRRERDYDDRYYDKRDRDRSQDRSRERGRSRDRSRERSKERIRSRDHYRSPDRSHRRSRSRSRSRDRDRRYDKYRHKRNRDRDERRRRDDSSDDERSSKSHSSKHRSDRERDGKDREKEKQSDKLTDEWLKFQSELKPKKPIVQQSSTITTNTQPVTQGTDYYQDAYGNYFPVNPNTNNNAEYYQNYPNYQSGAVIPDANTGYAVPGQPPLQQMPQSQMYGQEAFPPPPQQQAPPPPPQSVYGVQNQPQQMYGVQGQMVQHNQPLMYGQDQHSQQVVPGGLAPIPVPVTYEQGPAQIPLQSQPVPTPGQVVGLPQLTQPPIQQGQPNILSQQGPPSLPYPLQPGLDAVPQMQAIPQPGQLDYNLDGMPPHSVPLGVQQGPHGMQQGLHPSNSAPALLGPPPPQQLNEPYPPHVPDFTKTTGGPLVSSLKQSANSVGQEGLHRTKSDGPRAPLLPTPFPTLPVLQTSVKDRSSPALEQSSDQSSNEDSSVKLSEKHFQPEEVSSGADTESLGTEPPQQSKLISTSEVENSPQSSTSSTTSSTSTGRLLPIKLGIKQDFQAGKEFEQTTPPPPPPSSSPQIKEGKPLKVKSRWRRWSELDMSSPNAMGFSPTQDSNVPSSTVGDSFGQKELSEEEGSQEFVSVKSKKDIVYDAWDPAADLVLPPVSKSVKKEPSVSSSKREKKEKEKEKLSVQNADVTSQTSSDSKSEEEEKTEDGTPKPPYYAEIDENVYLGERKKSKKMKEVRRMLCDCTTSREDREMGYEACGEDCLNRMLYIECGSRCPCGEYCTNKRFQKKQYSNVEPFVTSWKGFGLKANEDLSPGDFIMEYVGEVLDYKQFKARVKQQAKMKQEHHYFMALNSDEVIDASYKGNVSRFMNHSCDPNCETQKWTVNGELRVGFFVKKDVTANTELTFDYQFERYGKEAQKCFCGADNCRGTIGGSKTTPLKTTRKVEFEEKKKKTELFEDEMVEEELEAMSLLENGLRNKDHVLTVCRLMVRAEAPEHRKTILKLLQTTTESNCLRLFLDYHGLELLWSWMADNQDEKGEVKVMILSTLKMFPITNKNILQDSKVLSLVQRWAGRDSVDELTVSSQIVTSTPPSKEMPQSILSSSTNKDKTTKKRVKFKLADDASSSDSESRSSATDNYGDVANNELFSDYDSSPSKPRDNQSKLDGLSDLRRQVLDKNMASESSGVMEFSSQTAQLSPADSTNKIDENNKSDIDTKMDDDSSSESHVDSSADKKQGCKVDADSSSKEVDDSDVKNIEDEKSCEFSANKSELESLAEELLYLWKDLKEIFKIPKKQQVEERKRIEKELEKPRTKHVVDRYEMIQDKSKQRAAGWDTGSRKRKRPPPPPPPLEDDSQDGRKTLLPTPPKMSKEERRQLFEAQVKAEDERAEIQRQQQAAILQQFYSEPNNLLYLQDPNNPFHQMTEEMQMQILQAHGLEGVDQQQYIDPNTGLPIPPEQLQKQFIDPNTGLPLTPEQLQAIDPNTGLPIVAEYMKAALQQQMQQSSLMYTEDGQPIPPQQQWVDHQQMQQPFMNAQGQLVQPPPSSQSQVITQGIVPQQDQGQILQSGQQVMYSSTPQGMVVPQTPNQTPGQVIQGSQPEIPQSLSFLQQVQQLQQQINLQNQLTVMPTPNTNVTATTDEDDPPPPPSPPKPKVQKLPPDWKTAKDSEGKVYFYHTVTRQTQWDPPTWDQSQPQSQDDMEIDSPLFEDIVKPKSKKQTTTAAADTSSETAKKIKDQFRNKMSSYVVLCLNPFRKPDCRLGRISSTEDFKHLARKLTHHVMAKEMKHCRHVEDLEVNENVKAKAKDYVKKYMSKFGSSYKKTGSPDI